MVGSVAGDGGRSAAGEVVTRDTCASGDDGSWRWPDTMVEGSPFQSSTALVTVEREGVIDAWVMPLSAERPAFEVPMRAHYGPNAFISVLAVRGRVSAPLRRPMHAG